MLISVFLGVRGFLFRNSRIPCDIKGGAKRAKLEILDFYPRNSKFPVIPQPLWGISIWNSKFPASLRGSKAKGAISSNRRHCEERVKRTTKQSKNSRFYLKFPVIPRLDPRISALGILEFPKKYPRTPNQRM